MERNLRPRWGPGKPSGSTFPDDTRVVLRCLPRKQEEVASKGIRGSRRKLRLAFPSVVFPDIAQTPRSLMQFFPPGPGEAPGEPSATGRKDTSGRPSGWSPQCFKTSLSRRVPGSGRSASGKGDADHGFRAGWAACSGTRQPEPGRTATTGFAGPGGSCSLLAAAQWVLPVGAMIFDRRSAAAVVGSFGERAAGSHFPQAAAASLWVKMRPRYANLRQPPGCKQPGDAVRLR